MLIDTSQGSTLVEFDSIETPQGVLSAWHCSQLENPIWDTFLNSSRYGQYHQTSIWAKVRILDGWQPLITLITLKDQLIGGFQMLMRSKAFIGKIGLVLKGPVVDTENPFILSFLLDTLKKTAKRNNIRALIIQPPDNHQNIAEMLNRPDFLDNHVDFMIKNNTVVFDLRESEENILKRMKHKKRQNINTAKKNNIVIREGQKDDLKTFFLYMTETCKRQHVTPSPSNENILVKMWELFSPQGYMKLFMAQCEGTDVSGIIVLFFNNTAYLWKFGWSGHCGNYRPNEMLYWEILKWAKNHGYLYADIGAIDSAFTDLPLRNRTLAEDLSKTYSRFKNDFGGEVVSLSKGFVYIPNPLIRRAYDLLMPHINSIPSLKKRILFRDA